MRSLVQLVGYLLLASCAWAQGTLANGFRLSNGTLGVAAAPTGYSDSFVGAAGTALATHDANWTRASTDTDPNTLTDVQLDGSGGVKTSGSATYEVYYAASTADTSVVILPANLTLFAGYYQVTIPCVRANASHRGYCFKMGNPSATAFQSAYWAKDGGSPSGGDTGISPNVPFNAAVCLKLVASGSSTVTLTASYAAYSGSACGSYTHVATTTDAVSTLASGSPAIMLNMSASGQTVVTGPWSDH